MLVEFAQGEPPLRRPDDEILPGLLWGRAEWIPSPCFWAALAATQPRAPELFAKPQSLVEEVGFCLLGGYGIRAEVNFAAHARLVGHGIYSRLAPAEEIETLLGAPLTVLGRSLRYRFPRQRSRRVSQAVARLRSEDIPTDDPMDLRAYLLTFNGIGPKTASWITRNWLGTDEVAIIDVHVERACRTMGLFGPDLTIQRDYLVMEQRFLEFSAAINVPAGTLDAIMWSEMRKLGKLEGNLTGMRERRDGKRRRRVRRGTERRQSQAKTIEATAGAVL